METASIPSPTVEAGAKLYVIVRADLPPGAQAAQGMHAAQEWVLENTSLARAWREASNTLVFLAVPDVDGLYRLHTKASKKNVRITRFCDDDLEEPFTAIVLDPVPEARLACKGLQTALRKVA